MKLGIDLSEHQAGFDFSHPALSAVEFAIMRTTDGTYRDHCFAEHVAGARAAGLEVAAYHYLRAPREGTTVEEQSEVVAEVLHSAGELVPVWLDVESPAGLSLSDVSRAHSSLASGGIEVAGIYTSPNYWRRHMLLADPAQFGGLWLADWGTNALADPADDSTIPTESSWPRPFALPTPALWQFTSRGRIGEYEVDLNLAR